MGDDHLLSCLALLLAEEPLIGYRAAHARLKSDARCSGVGLKKVQTSLQRLREAQRPTACQPAFPRSIPDAPSDAELAEWRGLGKWSEVVAGRLRLVDIPGRGKGFVAARDVKRGDSLLVEAALCSSASGPSEFCQMASQCRSQDVRQFFEKEVSPLTTGTGTASDLLCILQNNVYQCSRDARYSGLFVATARFNHSCSPNAFVDSCRSCAVVRALCDIPEGEEVLTSYVPVSDDLPARQAKLAAKDFVCDCRRCQDDDPRTLVPCACGRSTFSARVSTPPKQVCACCDSSFDRDLSLGFLRKIEEANEFMRSAAAAQCDARELVKKLSPLRVFATAGTANGAPPAHPESMQLLNALANCYRFCATHLAGESQSAAVADFFACKAEFMTAYDIIHGGAAQRDVSYLINLQRLLQDPQFEASVELRARWTRNLEAACWLQFGQAHLPCDVIADDQG